MSGEEPDNGFRSLKKSSMPRTGWPVLSALLEVKCARLVRGVPRTGRQATPLLNSCAGELPRMRIIYFTLLCCAAVLPAACVPGGGLRPGVPEKTFLGYRIEVPDNKESARVAAEQQARAFCESEKKQYVFSRFVTWSTVRLGRYVPTYSFYFVCNEPQVVKFNKPEKLTPQKSTTVAGKEEQPRQEEAASAGRKASKNGNDCHTGAGNIGPLGEHTDHRGKAVQNSGDRRFKRERPPEVAAQGGKSVGDMVLHQG